MNWPQTPRRRHSFEKITFDGERFYKELGEQGEHRYIAGFSYEIYHAQQSQRERACQEAMLKISDMNAELSFAKKDRDLEVVGKRVDEIIENAKMQKLIHYTLTPTSTKSKMGPVQTCAIHYSVDIEEWTKAGLLDGIFVYITDHTEKTDQGTFKVSAYDITRHYKDKYVIEQDFRDLKNIINIRPLYVRLPEHVRALVGISIIAQFINVFLARKLNTIGLSILDFYSLLEKSGTMAILN